MLEVQMWPRNSTRVAADSDFDSDTAGAAGHQETAAPVQKNYRNGLAVAALHYVYWSLVS